MSFCLNLKRKIFDIHRNKEYSEQQLRRGMKQTCYVDYVCSQVLRIWIHLNKKHLSAVSTNKSRNV